MNKLTALLLVVLLAIVIGGVYGALHDELTYSIAPEYYTRFKFYQFGMADEGEVAVLARPRQAVALVGVLATWWMGALIGLVLGVVGLGHRTGKALLRYTIRAFGLTLLVAFLTGLLGLVYGWFFLAGQPRTAFSGWYIPDNVQALDRFVAVGSMHNFSYLGGLLGLATGVFYTLRARRKNQITLLKTG